MTFASAARDASHFPSPETVDPRRPVESYLFSGVGEHASVDREIGHVGLTELFRAVFRKKGLRRAAGPQGQLKKVPRVDGLFEFTTEDWASLWPLPTSMKVAWDAE